MRGEGLLQHALTVCVLGSLSLSLGGAVSADTSADPGTVTVPQTSDLHDSSAGRGRADGVGALEPGFQFEGLTAAGWAVRWWQWAMADARTSPLRDTSGIFCASGQQGNVWFLAATSTSTPLVKQCTVPVGRHIFFPAYQLGRWPLSANSPLTCEQAKQQASIRDESLLEVVVEVDGVALEAPKRHRAATQECFDAFGRRPEASRPFAGYPAASEGYWIMLEPLAIGDHVIRFTARARSRESGRERIIQDTEYRISVAPGG